MARWLADLGTTTKTHRLPCTSDDTPFSEAPSKTTKRCPGFPNRFNSLHRALGFGRVFFPWYNTQHRHGGVDFLTPGMLHYGQAERVLQLRAATLAGALAVHPQHFKGRQRQWLAVQLVGGINLPKPSRRPATKEPASAEPRRATIARQDRV